MAANIWQHPQKSIPKDAPANIHRVPFDKSDQGARKSHISGIAPKNSNDIRHVS